MNLTRQPIRQKVRVTKARDPRHLDLIRSMCCCICHEYDILHNILL